MFIIGNQSCDATRYLLNESDRPTGILVDTPQQAAEQILRLLNDPDLIRQLQDHAQQWFGNRFSMKQAEQDLLSALSTHL